jgi:hypothetical protein
VIKRVHANWRGVSLWRGDEAKAIGSHFVDHYAADEPS